MASKVPPPPWHKRALRWAWQLAVVAVAYLLLSAYQERSLKTGAASDFRLQALAGEQVALSDLRGKRVLLHFWATWCGVCKLESGAINAVHRRAGDDEVVLSIVSDADDVEAIRSYVANEGIEYPVLLATDEVIQAYGVRAFPTNYFIGRDGNVADHTVGMSFRVPLMLRLWLAR